jgi:CRISPR-associated protein Csh1
LKDNEKKKSYREIIKSIYYTNPKDLKNFYLLNYYSKSDNGWKLQIKDLDYVENFQYMTTLQIENFLKIKNGFILNNFYDRELSVFQFEKIINELIFQRNLQRHYFSDYKDIKITYWKIDSANSNSILKNYLIKYRQNFYDYIYKSHQSAIGLIDFREMLLDIIIDDIRHDDKNKDGYSIYENEIKEKLNLLFSLNQKKETKLDSGEFIKLKTKMRDSLGYWLDSLELKADGKTFKKEFIGGVEFIEEDNKLYAFLCGQLARFLISKKKGKNENKSHADFSGFTEWQTSKLLKEYMWEIHRKYAHELKFDKKYDNAMSMIMSYRDDLEIEDVMEYMIAGYFSNNQIRYQDNNIEESENE